MSDLVERPMASEETEERVRDTFPLEQSPEEFAARDGYGWLDFPFARFRYRDEALDQWIQKVGQILRAPDQLRACQSKYLNAAEMRLIRRYMEDDDERLDDD